MNIIHPQGGAYGVVSSTENASNTNQQINGFHDDPEHETMDTQNDNDTQQDAASAQEQQPPQDYMQEMEEVVTPQTEEEEQRSTTSEPFVHKSEPKRRALGVVDHVSDNIYGIKVRAGKYAATKSADGIRNSIDAAIKFLLQMLLMYLWMRRECICE